MALITFAQAQAHLRLDDAIVDHVDLQTKIDLAEAIVRDYLTTTDATWTATMAAWTAATAPGPVVAAILLQLGELYRFRGDDDDRMAPTREHGYLAPAVVSLLHRYRDPALA